MVDKIYVMWPTKERQYGLDMKNSVDSLYERN